MVAPSFRYMKNVFVLFLNVFVFEKRENTLKINSVFWVIIQRNAQYESGKDIYLSL